MNPARAYLVVAVEMPPDRVATTSPAYAAFVLAVVMGVGQAAAMAELGQTSALTIERSSLASLGSTKFPWT